MKNLTSIFMLLLVTGSVMGQSNAIMDFQRKYKDTGKYFSIKIEGGLLKILSNAETNDPEGEEFLKLINGIDAIDIHSICKSESDFSTGDANDFMRQIKRDNFEDLMVVNDSDSRINFLVKESHGKVSDLILLVNNTDEFMVMNISGDIDLHTISKLSQKMNFKGSENLEKLKEE